MMKNKFATYLCAAVLLVFFGTFLFLPLYTVLAEGLDKDILLEVFRNRLYMEGLWNAFAISVVTTFYCRHMGRICTHTHTHIHTHF